MLGFTTKHLEAAPTLGDKLKERRESLAVEIDRVAKKLRIKTSYLQNLEASNYDKLPADVYTRAFVKKYAQFLDVDAVLVVEEYDKERKLRQNIKGLLAYSELPYLRRSQFNITSQTVGKIFIIFICLLVGGYFFYQLSFLFEPPKIILLSPKNDLIIRDDKLEFIGKIKPYAYLTINNQEVYIDKEGNFKVELLLNQGLNTIELIAKNRLNKSVSLIRKVVKE